MTDDLRDPSERALTERFEHHPPSSPEIAEAHERVRAAFAGLAVALYKILPDCRETDRCLDALDDSCKHANAAIARCQEANV